MPQTSKELGVVKQEEQGNLVHVNFSKSKKKQAPSLVDEEKIEHFRSLMEEGMVLVMLDPRLVSVQVPKHFKSQPELRLNFSYQFHLPDLCISEESLSATLSFPEGFFYCVLPWQAIFGFYSYELDKGVIWPQHAPVELVEELLEHHEDPPITPSSSPKKPRLYLVTDDSKSK